MSLWRKRNVHHSEQKHDNLVNIVTSLSIQSKDLSIKREKAMREVQRLGQEIEQEPVGKFAKFTDGIWREVTDGSAGVSLYTTPPQRTWVGLTDEEIADCAEKMEASDPTDSFWREFFRGIEAKLKEKNT